jgi:4-oxalocrotonate tautomerase
MERAITPPHFPNRENPMPHIIVKLWPGKTEEQKQQLADRITKDVMEVFGSKNESISVAMEEVSKDEWQEKVFKPDVLDKADRLYKKHGSMA